MPEAPTIADPNKHIYDFLEYYCSSGNDFDYAVLIKGTWGSGKTHLIEHFIEKREEDPELKTLYVSLYGMTTTAQIDEAFFRQLHPILSSKGMKIAASITKSILKTAIKLDLTGDGKDDVTVSSALPDLDFQKYFANPHKCLLIFDDLERCNMPIGNALGYINALVEHEGLKTIIIANEEPLIEKERSAYTEIKEKLIGQTLEIKSSAPLAIDEFIGQIKDHKTREFLKEYKISILELHSQSLRDNLRILKQALWDFEKIGRCLNENHWAKKDVVAKILQSFMVLSMEFRSGKLDHDDFKLFSISPVLRQMKRKTEGSADKLDQLEKKYTPVSITQDVIDVDILEDVLVSGWVDPDNIRKDLDKSSYYADPKEMLPWQIAWHGFNRSDDEFEAVVPVVEKEFADRKYDDNGTLLHVFGLRLMFSEIGAINDPASEVVKQCKAYIDDLATSNRIGNRIENDVGLDFTRAYFGLGIANAGTSEFREIYEYYMEAAQKAYLAALPRLASSLFSLMQTDMTKFFRELCINNFEASTYYNIPILKEIDASTFADGIISLSPENQVTVFSAFKARYETGALDRELKDEKPWLEELYKIMTEKASHLRIMSRHRLTTMMDQSLKQFVQAS
ncbi:putative DNA-binding ribbon-helix-helix protein [Methylobacterium sp. OAE515]|uniref:P-loop NTPase fold protein n=1 Tax=Methylobacterium sp. OAE515 TaxID=2817895 RepID=UPI00178A05A5